MSRRRYVWRVTATYPAGPVGGAVQVVRHFHSRQAAEHRAAVWRQGRTWRPDGHPEGSGQAAVEPALAVTIDRSDAVTGWTPVAPPPPAPAPPEG